MRCKLGSQKKMELVRVGVVVSFHELAGKPQAPTSCIFCQKWGGMEGVAGSSRSLPEDDGDGGRRGVAVS